MAVISAELASFALLLNSVVERVINKGVPFSSFKRLLHNRLMPIREEGFSDLADSIADDLVQFEQESEELARLRSEGATSYISSRLESITKAKEAQRGAMEQELRQLQTRSSHIRASLSTQEQHEVNLLQSIELYDAKLSRLKKLIEDAETARDHLQLELAGVKEARSRLYAQVKSFDDQEAKLERDILKLLAPDDSSKAFLEKELKENYEEELSRLENQLRLRQLSC